MGVDSHVVGDGMFQGASSLSLDTKGRLAIPVRHRDALTSDSGGFLALTAHPHGCLLVYPISVWASIRETLNAIPSVDRNTARYKRLLVGHAEEVQLDAAGRVLISPELRGLAKLDKQVWLVGQGNGLELWSDADWRREREEASFEAQQGPPPGLENLVL